MAAQEREGQAGAPASEATPPPAAAPSPPSPQSPPPAPPEPSMSFFTNPANEPHVHLIVLLIITFVLGAILMSY